MERRLQQYGDALEQVLHTTTTRLLLRWIDKAVVDLDYATGAKCYAHLALLYKSVPVEKMDWRVVALIIAAQVFVTQHLNRGGSSSGRGGETTSDSKAGGGMRTASKPEKKTAGGVDHVSPNLGQDSFSGGVSELEVFDLFESKRVAIRQRMETEGADFRSQVLEAVARIATHSGGLDEPVQLRAAGESGAVLKRSWVESPKRPGVYVLEQELPAPDENFYKVREVIGRDKRRRHETFEEYLLRVTTGETAVMISLNTGEYSVRHQEMSLLPG